MDIVRATWVWVEQFMTTAEATWAWAEQFMTIAGATWTWGRDMWPLLELLGLGGGICDHC